MPFRILALGSNGSGQLGIGHSNDISETEQCIFDGSEKADDDEDEEVTKVVGGGNHTLVLTSKGRVWAAGRNDDGRCGGLSTTTTNKLQTFRRVETVGGVVTHVAGTWEASMLVVDKLVVLSCGTGFKGELGHGPEVTKSPVLKPAGCCDEVWMPGTEVVDIVAGVNHVLVLTYDGEVFGWGASRKGQLGDEMKSDKVVWVPRKIEIPFSVRQIAAGRDFSYMVGCNNEQVLLGDAKHFAGGTNLPLGEGEGEGVLYSGWSNIYYHSTSGVYGVGRNDRGQLGPPNSPPLKHFGAGSEHCVSYTHDDKVVAWGWGEHGNCGRPAHDEKGDMIDTYSSIPVSLQSGESVSHVAAGCATSFIVLN